MPRPSWWWGRSDTLELKAAGEQLVTVKVFMSCTTPNQKVMIKCNVATFFLQMCVMNEILGTSHETGKCTYIRSRGSSFLNFYRNCRVERNGESRCDAFKKYDLTCSCHIRIEMRSTFVTWRETSVLELLNHLLDYCPDVSACDTWLFKRGLKYGSTWSLG